MIALMFGLLSYLLLQGFALWFLLNDSKLRVLKLVLQSTSIANMLIFPILMWIFLVFWPSNSVGFSHTHDGLPALIFLLYLNYTVQLCPNSFKLIISLSTSAIHMALVQISNQNSSANDSFNYRKVREII